MTFRFSTRKADGTVCCAGNEPDFPRCPKCKTADDAAIDHSDYAAPDSYGPALKAMRAEPSRKPTFAEQYRERREAEFAAEYAAADARHASQPAPRALSAAELEQFAPPNPYDAPLAAMKENR